MQLSDPFDLIRLCRHIRKDRCCRIGNILIEHPPHLKIAFPPRAHPTRLPDRYWVYSVTPPPTHVGSVSRRETPKGQRSDCREVADAAVLPVGYPAIARKIARPPLLKWRFAYMTGCVEIYTDVNYHGECDQSQENYWTAKFVLYICFLIYFVSVSRHNILPNRVIYFGENF